MFTHESFVQWASAIAGERATYPWQKLTPATWELGPFSSETLEPCRALFDHGFLATRAPVWSRGALTGHEIAIVSRTYCRDDVIDHPPEGLRCWRLPPESGWRTGDLGTVIATVVCGVTPAASCFVQLCEEVPAYYLGCVLSHEMVEYEMCRVEVGPDRISITQKEWDSPRGRFVSVDASDRGPSAQALRFAQSDALQCEWVAWRVLGPRRLAVDLPPGNCTDAAGAIRTAQALMPDVERIQTYVEGLPDTAYAFNGTAWFSIPNR